MYRLRSCLTVSSLAMLAGLACGDVSGGSRATGNVVFFHPDGMGVNHWGAVRMHVVGPDGRLNWDSLPGMAVYTGHMTDALTATSHGGATVHAYGVKVKADSYGTDAGESLTARSGRTMSLLQEARERGLAVGLINTGTITEPGTGAFAASVGRRSEHDEIARRILELGPQIILGGGERYFLPADVQGVHGAGARQDGLDLVALAKERGYKVVYTREELRALPDETERVLGLFAARHTFNATSEERLARSQRSAYQPGAPSIAEMVEAALKLLARGERRFFLVAEEEGTDNFANANNAAAQLEAGRRADEALGVLRRFVRDQQETLIITTSDSDAGGMQVVGYLPGDALRRGRPLPERDPNGAPLDGVGGTGTEPFLSAPDRNGRRWPFAVAWATFHDVAGGILVRADGLNAKRVHGTFDSTDIYRICYLTLFGEAPD